MLKKILYRCLPPSTFQRLRHFYFSTRRKMYKPLSAEQMKDVLLNKMKIKTGDTLFIHSSIDYLNIDFSANVLLNMILEIVGKEGTVLFPAWHFNYRAEEYLNKNLVFDVKKSASAMGLLSEFARRNKSAYRSLHPINSIVAIGKHAEELTFEHHTDIYPCGKKSPYYKMMQYDAKIIGIGVTTHYISFLHCVEDVIKEKFPLKTRLDEVFEGRVRLVDKTEIRVNTLVASENIIHRHIPQFLGKHISNDALKCFQKKGSDFFVADSKLFFEEVVNCALKGNTIYNA